MSILRYFKPPLPLYERESLLTHTRPHLSRASLEIFFELEIFSDDAACPKIKSHENLSNENFANEEKANYGSSAAACVMWNVRKCQVLLTNKRGPRFALLVLLNLRL